MSLLFNVVVFIIARLSATRNTEFTASEIVIKWTKSSALIFAVLRVTFK